MLSPSGWTLPPASGALLLSFEGLLRNRARAWRQVPGLDGDDLFSECWLAGIQALRTYDARRGALSGFVWQVVDHHLAQMKRKARAARRCPETRVQSLSERSARRSAEAVPDLADPAAEVVAKITGERLLEDCLQYAGDPSDRRVLAGLAAGESLEEIAQALGVTVQSAGARLARLRTHLRAYLSEEEYS